MSAEGYAQTPEGIRITSDHERAMTALWERSSLMPFCDWDPEPNGKGERWDDHYRAVIGRDVSSRRLTRAEGDALLAYLDVVGT